MGLATTAVTKDNPEKVFMPVTNVSGTTVTKGQAVALAIGGNSFDGKSVVLADSGVAADLPGFLGVAERDIADTENGLIQILGFADSIAVDGLGTSVTVTKGDPLVPGATPGELASAEPTFVNSGLKYALVAETLTVSASGFASGYLRCR